MTLEGWMEGDHPTPSEGEVGRQVHFHGSSGTKHRTVEIRVINCGSYYVYYLPSPGACARGYCIVPKGGLALIGGWGAVDSMEVWDANTGKVCRGPGLPDNRSFHTAGDQTSI